MLRQVCRIIRTVRLSLQAGLSSSYFRSIPSGLLGSRQASPPLTGITPLLSYYEPIRLPTLPVPWLCLSNEPHNDAWGLSVPDLVCRHAPSPSTPRSRTIARTRCFIVRAGLALSDGLATPIGVTRLVWVRLTLRLAPSPSGASRDRLLRRHARAATRLTGHSMVNSFQFTRQNRFH